MKKQIVVQDIINDLDNGLKRKEIKEKHGLTGKQMTYLFKHPSLKGKRAKANVEDELEIVDTTGEIVNQNITIVPFEEEIAVVPSPEFELEIKNMSQREVEEETKKEEFINPFI